MLAGSASGAKRGTLARKSCLSKRLAGADGAGEETHAQRAPGDKADAQLLAQRKHLRFRAAPQHRVLVLDHGHRVHRVRAADRLQPGFGQAVVQHLALRDQILDRPGHVLDRHLRIDAMLVEQVDAVGAQTPQLGLDHLPDVFGPAVRARRVAAPVSGSMSKPNLVDMTTRSRRLPCSASPSEFLRHEGAVGLGGVEQRDAQIHGAADERDAALRGSVLLAYRSFTACGPWPGCHCTPRPMGYTSNGPRRRRAAVDGPVLAAEQRRARWLSGAGRQQPGGDAQRGGSGQQAAAVGVSGKMGHGEFPYGGHRIQLLLGEELGHQVGDLDVVQVGHQEVRVAADADLRKMHQPGVAAMLVDGVDPEPGHGQPHAPVVLAALRGRLDREVVAVVDDDRDAGELLEVRQRHRLGRQRAGGARHRRRAVRLAGR